jgi:hypothetical protein
LAAITKAGQLTPEIQAALAPEWASFPTMAGKSYYGQPVKKTAQIQQFFEKGAQQIAPPQIVAQPPAPKSSVPQLLTGLLGLNLVNDQPTPAENFAGEYKKEIIKNLFPNGLFGVLGII